MKRMLMVATIVGAFAFVAITISGAWRPSAYSLASSR
jgi:hypothetical protein